MPLSHPFLRRHGLMLAFAVTLAACFLVYVRYNQRYIGAVDWYGYYQQGMLFKSGRVTLPVDLPATKFPAAVPLGYFVTAAGKVAPQYPPGFPLLIATAALVHLEFYLQPLVGLASCLVMFWLIRDLTADRVTAVIFAVLWGCCPLVVYGSTMMMSDLEAALFLLLSYRCYRQGRVAWSAVALVFAGSVRPTNVLYLVVFLPVLWRDRRLWRFALGLALPGAAFAIYNQYLYGAPWRTGYQNLSYDLVTGFFGSHLAFYLQQCLWQFSPVVVVLAGLGLRQRRPERWFFVSWFAVFLLFYCFWRPAEDAWWWTRFLLPGFAPIFFLAAIGFSRLRAPAGERPAGSRAWRPGWLACFGLTLLTPVYFVGFGLYQHDLWSLHKGEAYYDVVRATEALVPPGSYVGSIEFAGSFRTYSPLQPFLSFHDNAPALIRQVLKNGHAVFLLVEPWNKSHLGIERLLHEFSAEKIRVLNFWGGIPLYQLTVPAGPKPPAP